MTTPTEPKPTDDTPTEEAPKVEMTEEAPGNTTEQPDGQNENSLDESPAKTAANREAAKYRRRAQEAETELDGYKTRVNNLQRQLVETQLPARLSADVFWKVGPDLGALINEDGDVDTAAVTEAANTVSRQIGLNQGPRAPQQKTSASQPWQSRNSFSSAFAPRRD